MEHFLERENKLRTDNYAKNVDDEQFLIKLNENLLNLEDTISHTADNNIPNIFIFGLPRSGTTLLYQVLAQHLDIAWPTNLMARFWETPVVGMRLSKILGLYEESSEYLSEHGVTRGASEPHEFGYFWMKWLNYKDTIMKGKEHEKTIAWEGLRKKLNAISAEAGKPVVYKNLLYAFHFEKLIEIQPNSIFICCKKDLADVATSILKTREKRYGDKGVWWSFRFPGYNSVINKSCYEQVLHQVKAGHEFLRKIIEKAASTSFFSINYANLNEELPVLIDSLSKDYGIVKKTEGLPEFKLTSHVGTPEHNIMSELLEKAFKSD